MGVRKFRDLKKHHPRMKMLKDRAREIKKKEPYFNHSTCLDIASEEVGYENYNHFLKDFLNGRK